MNEHRIEFAMKTPDGIKTMIIAVRYDADPEHLAVIARQFRRLLEVWMNKGSMKQVIHSRDYPVPPEAP